MIPIPPALGSGLGILQIAQAILAQMQAENARHANLLDELRGERHRQEAVTARLEGALERLLAATACKHPVKICHPGEPTYCAGCGETGV